MWENSKAACKRKIRYPNETAAMVVAFNSTEARGVPVTYYRCSVCRGYHTTKVRNQTKWRKEHERTEISGAASGDNLDDSRSAA